MTNPTKPNVRRALTIIGIFLLAWILAITAAFHYSVIAGLITSAFFITIIALLLRVARQRREALMLAAKVTTPVKRESGILLLNQANSELLERVKSLEKDIIALRNQGIK